jgi:hypothetical protein
MAFVLARVLYFASSLALQVLLPPLVKTLSSRRARPVIGYYWRRRRWRAVFDYCICCITALLHAGVPALRFLLSWNSILTYVPSLERRESSSLMFTDFPLPNFDKRVERLNAKPKAVVVPYYVTLPLAAVTRLFVTRRALSPEFPFQGVRNSLDEVLTRLGPARHHQPQRAPKNSN